MTEERSPSLHPLPAFARRIPATLTMVVLILAVGVIWRGLWTPFEDSDLFPTVAYGLPNLAEGKWWTPLTGTFFVNQPWVYVFTIAGFWGMAYLEFRRGTRVAIAYYAVGQLFAIFATALVLLVLSSFPWAWATTQAQALDVGASGGTMACIAAAVGLFRPPRRVRGWLILLGFVFIAMLFWGKLADLEHLLAVLLILVVDRTLRVRHTTVREQRLIAVMAILVLGAVEIITTLLPTDGPFGPTEPASGGFIDLAIDLVVILVLVNGLRRGRRWTWVLALLLGILNIVTAALVLTLITVFSQAQVDVRWDGETELALANGFLWLIMLVYLIWVRRAFHARRKSKLGMQPSPTADDMKHELRTHGGGTLSWMTTWDGNSYARVPGGIVAYQRRNGVALALADPIGPAHARAEAVQEFIRTAELAGLVPCFFSADEATRAAVPSTWRSIVVADDTIVDLPGLEFTGKRWNSVRTSLNKAGREDMTFRMTHFKAEPWGVQQQLRAISEAWVGDKDLPEMRFTLGTLDEAEDPEVRLALALAPNGDVDGFLSWLPVYGDDGEVRGWTLDLMRRREGGFGPVMEFLIGSSARQFSDEGAQIMSLSGAPLAHDYPPDAGVIAALSDRLAEALEPVYGFGSLHRFKQKFHPRYETMYLLFRDESDLTRIGGALTRAFLPDATLRQFAGAGLELVRGGGKD
ncbi:bifunctional lysylphosphatidylglycerol flippase/synthetase MprF [Microbacterium sp. J1-1]|uniref:bifunctional lysylphosphatidylglycerol flippase/synthetase MprF n=1 Tax=Microbacterium sp. J1-1 TaxID=2992441 RepID=UPI0021150F36|nr:phosphatidylglycerol lysyltransferase domain-containing protein [Microbacterium sp. J1-1]UUE19911.1 phosphatidylglycerol lysyltransferase domain-containing protein [Microbacterium sp. J1-1]